MPFEGITQPETISLGGKFRLKKYDGAYEKALVGYRDPVVYQNSEGIFDPEKAPDMDYIRRMMTWLDAHGELYFVEALENGEYVAIGDVTKAGKPAYRHLVSAISRDWAGPPCHAGCDRPPAGDGLQAHHRLHGV